MQEGISFDSLSGASDIPGLKSRVFRPLEFLGLYGTMFGACHRHDIPAKRVNPFLFLITNKSISHWCRFLVTPMSSKF
jgi:hypothetical protein